MIWWSHGTHYIRHLPLSCLTIDRIPINPDTLALVKHLDNGGTVPPIHIQYALRKWYIVDGRHRYTACKLLGRKTILCRYGIRSQDK